jgi:hypothetical protein
LRNNRVERKVNDTADGTSVTWCPWIGRSVWVLVHKWRAGLEARTIHTEWQERSWKCGLWSESWVLTEVGVHGHSSSAIIVTQVASLQLRKRIGEKALCWVWEKLYRLLGRWGVDTTWYFTLAGPVWYRRQKWNQPLESSSCSANFSLFWTSISFYQRW